MIGFILFLMISLLAMVIIYGGLWVAINRIVLVDRLEAYYVARKRKQKRGAIH